MNKSLSFNKKSKEILYPKIKLNPNIKKEFQKLTKKQMAFNSPRPVQEYKRFISFREAFTGVDPYYNYISFRNRDLIKPMKRPSLYDKFDLQYPVNRLDVEIKANKSESNLLQKWAVGTTARAPDEEKLPKKQQFKNYYFPPEYNNKSPEEYRRFFLKTDHIAIKIPKINRINSEKSFIKMKGDFSRGYETKMEDRWMPYTKRNMYPNCCSSSKDYDIINFKPKNIKKDSLFLHKSAYNKNKGFMEFFDLSNVYIDRYNKEYTKRIKEIPIRFHKYNGAFSNMYDASNRNGKITLPFTLRKKIK